MQTDTLAPIAIVAYNRPWHLRQTVDALLQNREAAASELYVFSDAAKNEENIQAVSEVRDYLKRLSGFKNIHVIERPENFGLARSVISAVKEVLQHHERIIVLEDDLVTSKFFLQYMNGALEVYADNEDVASIHGFFYNLNNPLPETFFLRGTDCLGWATWRRAWRHFESDGAVLLEKLKAQKLEYAFNFDNTYPYVEMLKCQIAGKTSSWAIRWHAAAYLKNMLTLNPGVSHVMHIGNDGSGTNFGNGSFLDTPLAQVPTRVKRIETREDVDVRNGLVAYYKEAFPKQRLVPRLAARIKNLIRNIMRPFR